MNQFSPNQQECLRLNIGNNTSARTLNFTKQAKAVTTNKIVTAWIANYNLIPRLRFFFLRNISAIS